VVANPLEVGMTETNIRPLEDGIERDLRGLNYGSYLHLDELLGAQQPISDHHDEMLFIIVHHTTELWMKLVIHEVRSAMALIAADELAPALKRLARVKHVQRQMTDQWSVLATLTPTEYSQFRDKLGKSSGFQSAQYRTLEFLLGNKNPAMVAVFAHDPEVAQQLERDLHNPSLYDEFLLYLSRRGYPIPIELIQRDFSQPHVLNTGLVRVFTDVYDDCEELVDIEDTFQTWRFRHLKTVERIIGHKRGTGGSSGVGFLARALSLTFFPELFAVRTEIGRQDEPSKGTPA
jgi:tryptophan 2,3-dioxygenase